MTPTVSFFFDERRAKKDNTYPVKIQIYHNRIRYPYKTGLAFSKEDYELLFLPNPKGKAKRNKEKLDSFKEKAEEIIGKLGDQFTIERFDKLYRQNRSDRGNAFRIFEDIINEFDNNGQIGTANNYRNSLSSFKKFVGTEKLFLSEINLDFLNRYERWMLTEGNMRMVKKGKIRVPKPASKNTVGMYLRNLRTVFNKAIADGEISQAIYPFGRNGYVIPSGRNFKRALDISDVDRFFNYDVDAEDEKLAFSKDMFVFTYLGNGLNLKDIALLRFKNLLSEGIIFNRAKTANTKKDKQVQITIDWDEEGYLKSIIERWGNKNHASENFVFPILNEKMNAKQKHAAIKQTIKVVNKHLKRISKDLGVDLKITTMVGRHTFATVAVNYGEATPLSLSKLMGNSEITSTNYIGDLPVHTRKKISGALLSFKKKQTA